MANLCSTEFFYLICFLAAFGWLGFMAVVFSLFDESQPMTKNEKRFETTGIFILFITGAPFSYLWVDSCSHAKELMDANFAVLVFAPAAGVVIVFILELLRNLFFPKDDSMPTSSSTPQPTRKKFRFEVPEDNE